MKYLIIYWIWLIVPFQFYMKSSTHVISQKKIESNIFHLNKHNYVEGLCNKIHFTCLLEHYVKSNKIAPKLI
jgi:hypothetical protein